MDGLDARPSLALRRERSGQTAEQVGFGTSGGEGETHPAGCLDEAGGDLDQAQTQSGELGPRQVARRGNGVADSEHQPIGASAQDEAHPDSLKPSRDARRSRGKRNHWANVAASRRPRNTLRRERPLETLKAIGPCPLEAPSRPLREVAQLYTHTTFSAARDNGISVPL